MELFSDYPNLLLFKFAYNLRMKNAHVIVYGLFVTSVTIHIHTATITNKILTTRVFEIISAILYIETTNVPVNNMESFQSNGMGIGIIY